MTYVTVYVDVELDEILGAMSKKELHKLSDDLIDDGYGRMAQRESPGLASGFGLEDPAKRLELITALRGMGYAVEPA